MFHTGIERLLLIGLMLHSLGCGGDVARDPAVDQESSESVAPVFSEVARASGIGFRHFNGGTGRFYFQETHGSGAAFLDYDGDGYQDLYAVNGAPLPPESSGNFQPQNALYRNKRDGTFAEATEEAGVGDRNFGMGVCAGDYDNDGDLDMYVTNFGPNVLYRNNGDGTFTDVAEWAGVDDPRLGTSAAFADYDNDGDLDLYVANNVRISLADSNKCYHGVIEVYCGPLSYQGESGALYRNEGDGTFADVTRSAGMHDESGRQLGVAFGDYDNDGDVDLYVANDMTPNFLFRNDGEGRFAEVGLISEVALDPDAFPEAGMGADWGDYNRDGFLDLVVCNFQWQSCRLLENQGNGFFEDKTIFSGLGRPTYFTLNFGTDLFDYDNDGDLDIFVANGHIEPNIEIIDGAHPTFAQHDHLFRNNRDQTFTEVSEQAGLHVLQRMVGRGAAVADYDNDGDLDIFVSNNNQRAILLRNDGGNGNHWLTIETVGTLSNRDGIGARISVTADDLVQIEEVKSGSSYLSQNDLRVHFGLGGRTLVDRIEVSWPSGIIQTLEKVAVDQFLLIEEPVQN